MAQKATLNYQTNCYEDSAFIIFTKDGIRELKKTHPTLKPGQHAVKVTISVPKDTFEKQKVPEVKINIPTSAIFTSVEKPKLETIDVVDQVMDKLK